MTADPRLTRAEVERIRDNAAERYSEEQFRVLADTALALMDAEPCTRFHGTDVLNDLRTAEARTAALEGALREAEQVFAPLLADADLDAGSNPAWLAVERIRALLSEPQDGEGGDPAPNIEPRPRGKLRYDKERRMIVGAAPTSPPASPEWQGWTEHRHPTNKPCPLCPTSPPTEAS